MVIEGLIDLPCASPEDVGFNSTSLHRIVQWQERMFKEQRLPFTQVVVGRRGKVCHFSTVGQRDLKAGINAEPDTICRIFSMSKPVSSIALMMLYEEGRFLLSDPVHLYLGEKWHKNNMNVYRDGDAQSGYTTEPCRKSITIRDVLCHTSGLTYGFDFLGIRNKLDQIYAKRLENAESLTLAQFVESLAELPLQFQPGSAWHYGYNVEVIGRLVELISGTPFDVFLQERIFDPLRMRDTGFVVPPEKRHRFARNYKRVGHLESLTSYSPGSTRHKVGLEDITCKTDMHERYTANYRLLEPGGGLVGSASDYARFCQMLLNGGELDGQVILSRKTLEWMTVNHLADNKDMKDMAKNAVGYSETAQDGVGFGLGFSIVLDPAKSMQLMSTGTFAWGGAASTLFWCDPKEELFCVFTTQLMFNDPLVMPLRSWLGQLVYGSLQGDLDPQRERLLPSRRSKL